MSEASSPFGYSNLPYRRSGPVLAAASRLLPGVGRVQAQVVPYAQAWQEANQAALAAPGALWVALGDSLTQGIGADAYDRGWVGQTRAALAATGRAFRVVNLSASGARTLDVLEQQVPVLEALGRAADLVTLLAGSNDLFRRARRDELPLTYAELLARVPVGTVVATLPNPTRTAQAVNAVIERVAAERGLVVAETRVPVTTDWRGKLAADHFHPNDLGYAGIAAVFTEAVLRSAGQPGTAG